ncbi:hypothetical protein EG834_15900, partial [bacterium]|nr:hypothetical protein [bacterium]
MIGLLVPSTGIYTSYALPVGTQIALLSIDNGKVWYTEQYQTTFGVLDPALAEGIESGTTTGWVDVDPTPCDTVSNPKNSDAGPTTGIADSAATSLEIIHEGDGWTILQLPDYSFPWGIVTVNGLVNVVDNGRQKLVQINESALQNPGLTLGKTAEPTTYDSVVDLINYTYELTNSGNVTLIGPFTVTDDKAAVTCPATTSLAPGASITCTASYTITQADLDAGSVTNTAAGHAMFGGSPVDSATDSATVNAVQSPGLVIVKEANPTTYDSVGDQIGYSYVLTNTGNTT